jgi:flagellar basal-body rod protein FlgB
MMWIDRLLSSRMTHAVELTARFAEERQRVLAENVASIDLPDYRSKRLDPRVFQSALREAFEASRKSGRQALELRGQAQVATDAKGRLRVQPAIEPAQNALFHDGTNAKVEELMSGAAENALLYGLATQVLGKRFDTLEMAVRGRVT